MGVKNELASGDNARERTIRFEEYLSLLDCASPHFKPVLTVAYNTGMRSGELQKLQWSHIDRKNMFIRLPKEITKKKRARNIPINHHVKTVLDNLPRSIKHEFVFTNYKGKRKGKSLSQKNGFAHLFKSACKKAGITYGEEVKNGAVFRDIRTTFKTNMLDAKIDRVYRELIVGHKLKGMDDYYLKPNEDTLKGQMEGFTQWLDGQLNSVNVDQSVDQGKVA
jgi:integrase